MTEKLTEKDLVTFKELVISNSIMVDTLAQLMIKKGIITEDEFYSKLKQVQKEYSLGSWSKPNSITCVGMSTSRQPMSLLAAKKRRVLRRRRS